MTPDMCMKLFGDIKSSAEKRSLKKLKSGLLGDILRQILRFSSLQA